MGTNSNRKQAVKAIMTEHGVNYTTALRMYEEQRQQRNAGGPVYFDTRVLERSPDAPNIFLGHTTNPEDLAQAAEVITHPAFERDPGLLATVLAGLGPDQYLNQNGRNGWVGIRTLPTPWDVKKHFIRTSETGWSRRLSGSETDAETVGLGWFGFAPRLNLGLGFLLGTGRQRRRETSAQIIGTSAGRNIWVAGSAGSGASVALYSVAMKAQRLGMEVVVVNGKGINEYPSLEEGTVRCVRTDEEWAETMLSIKPGTIERPLLVALDSCLGQFTEHPDGSAPAIEHNWFEHLLRLMVDPYTCVVIRAQRLSDQGAQDVLRQRLTIRVLMGHSDTTTQQMVFGQTITQEAEALNRLADHFGGRRAGHGKGVGHLQHDVGDSPVPVRFEHPDHPPKNDDPDLWFGHTEREEEAASVCGMLSGKSFGTALPADGVSLVSEVLSSLGPGEFLYRDGTTGYIGTTTLSDSRMMERSISPSWTGWLRNQFWA